MKIKLNKWLGLTAIALIFLTGLDSCIKNHVPKETDFSKVTNVVDLPVNGFKVIALDIVPDPTDVKIYAELGGPLPDKDVVITLALDPTAIDDYNTANGTTFVPLADSSYSLPSLTITIKKGERLGFLNLSVFSTKVDLTVPAALAFKITDAQGIAIADNLKSLIYSVGVKNKYDGQYDLDIESFGWGAYGIADGETYSYPGGVGLLTSGANSVTFSTGLLPAFATGGGPTAFGATTPQFTFDPVTNNLTEVINLDPDDGRGRTLMLNPAVTDSRYDPNTKTIYAAFIMNQNGRPAQRFYDTLTYVSPRP